MKVGTGGNLDLSREYHKKLHVFGVSVLFMMELSFNVHIGQFFFKSSNTTLNFTYRAWHAKSIHRQAFNVEVKAEY